MFIAISDMTLGEKLRYLRLMEGNLRGLGRDMTQLEVVRAINKELKEKISQSYLSQIENGARPHLTNKTRLLLSSPSRVPRG
jgi:transcriptional regulator with XRE-family HTH domain